MKENNPVDTPMHKRQIDFFHGKLSMDAPPKRHTEGWLRQNRGEGGIGGGEVINPPTFLELTYSENRVGHSENYGKLLNIITKF